MKLNKLKFRLITESCNDIKEWIHERIWGRFAFVGFVTNGSVFPIQRINGTPLEVGDYVKVSPIATLPFTIGDIEFKYKWQIARYTKDGSWELVDKKPPYYIFRDWVKSLRVSQDYGCTWENLGPVTPNITASATIDNNYGTPEVNVLKQPKKEDDIDFNLHFDFHNLRGNGIEKVEVDHYENVVEEDEKVYTYTYCRITYTDGTELYPIIFKALKGDPALIDGQGAIEILSEVTENPDLGIKFIEGNNGIFTIDSTALRNALQAEVSRAETAEQELQLNKVDKTNDFNKIYGTDNNGQTTYDFVSTIADETNKVPRNSAVYKEILDNNQSSFNYDDTNLQKDIINLQLGNHNGAIKVSKTIDFNDKIVFGQKGQTLTNKTIDADNNTISNLGVSNFKSGVVRTSIRETSQASHANLATEKAIIDAIDALPEPMVFKGSLGEGGTITTLPTASLDNEGFTYKVITDGTYASQTAKVGDTFISDGTTWVLIPSGDEPSGTVSNIEAGNGLQTTNGEPITDTGTLSVKLANSTGLGFDANGALQVLLDQGLGFHNGKIRAEIGQGMMYDNNKLKIKTKNNGGISVDSDGIFIDFDTTIPSTATDYKAPTTKAVYDTLQDYRKKTDNEFNLTKDGTDNPMVLKQTIDGSEKSTTLSLEQKNIGTGIINYQTFLSVPYLWPGYLAAEYANITEIKTYTFSVAKGTGINTFFVNGANGIVSVTGVLGVAGSVTVTGDVTASAFYQSSDERLKDKVGDLELDRCKELLNIPTLLYKLKSDETNKVQIGTIAQEVQKVMPELVQEDKEGHLGVAYDRMSIICLELLKDAYKQIAELKQEVEQLKFK